MGLSKKLRSSMATFVVAGTISGGSLAGPFFSGIGDLSGGNFASTVNGISDDGSTVVGRGWSSFGQSEAFRWTAESGIVGLGDLPGSGFRSIAYDVSADGSIVVGEGSTPDDGTTFPGFRWTQSTGMIGYDIFPPGNHIDRIYGITPDGSVAVGRGYSDTVGEAYRWSASTGAVGLGTLAGGSTFSEARAISSDGQIIVGNANSALGTEAFRWTQATGMVGLGDLIGGIYNSIARATSSDGSVIVGLAFSELGREAFRWTESGGMVGLGDLASGSSASDAYAVSGDGQVIVGSATGGAFIWDPVNGMRLLEAVLASDFGLDLTGWSLASARAISADGLVLAGNGTNPFGQQEAWVVNLREELVVAVTEPAALTLFALGIAVLGAIRRRASHRIAGGMMQSTAILIAALLGFTAPAGATIVKNIEFNSDGMLPSADPAISLANNTGNPETALYSVSGGVLAQRNFSVNGNASYGFPNGALSGGGIDPSQSLSIEVRLRVGQINGLGGAFFQAFDGTHRYSIFFSPGAVQALDASSGFEAFAIDLSQFHTYRLESQGGTNAFDFYIDDALTFSGFAAATTGLNGFNFGDGITEPGAGADADWYFVRFSQPLAEADIPEPFALALFALGLAVLGVARRSA